MIKTFTREIQISGSVAGTLQTKNRPQHIGVDYYGTTWHGIRICGNPEAHARLVNLDMI